MSDASSSNYDSTTPPIGIDYEDGKENEREASGSEESNEPLKDDQSNQHVNEEIDESKGDEIPPSRAISLRKKSLKSKDKRIPRLTAAKVVSRTLQFNNSNRAILA